MHVTLDLITGARKRSGVWGGRTGESIARRAEAGTLAGDKWFPSDIPAKHHEKASGNHQ